MPRALWIPDLLRDFDVEPVLVDGWDRRGSDYFDPNGSIDHHTAGAASGYMPSLKVLINGRSDLPGPLCQVAQPRAADGDNRVYVVAAGRANHAGRGSWKGLTGNSSVLGLERENVGTPAEPWTEWSFEIACRVHAAFAKGAGFSPDHVCRHQEWAPGRKVDSHSVAGQAIRRRVLDILGRPSPQEIAMRVPDCVGFAVLCNDDVVLFTKQGHVYHFDADGVERGGDDPAYVDAYSNHPELGFGKDPRECVGGYAVNRSGRAVADGAADAVGVAQVFDDSSRYRWFPKG